MHYLLKGAILGFLIAAPVGPIGLLCITRTLRRGWIAGFASGLGAAVADTFYALVAAFGMSTVTSTFTLFLKPLHVVGAAFLCILGIGTLKSRTLSAVEPPPESASALEAFASTAALTIVNPATIFSFVAVFATALGPNARTLVDTMILVGGVFAGSSAWWLALASGTSLARKKLSADAVTFVNRAAGVLLIGFAIYLLVS